MTEMSKEEKARWRARGMWVLAMTMAVCLWIIIIGRLLSEDVEVGGLLIGAYFAGHYWGTKERA